jgi:hypothetical protein
MDNMDTLTITWRAPFGVPGVDDAPDNPFARSVIKLLQEGTPHKRLSMAFFAGQQPRWLGVFVHSAGDRILFFPGYAEGPRGVEGFINRVGFSNQEFTLDHVSLEKNLKNWHVTNQESGEHIGDPKTVVLGDSRYFWFGLSVAEESALRIVKSETTVAAQISASDSQRRAEVVEASRHDAEFPMVSLSGDQPAPAEPSFLHFAFVVGMPGFETYTGPELGLPFGSPFLAQPLQDMPSGLPTRIHRTKLSETVDLQITVCQHVGRLTVPMALTAPAP